MFKLSFAETRQPAPAPTDPQGDPSLDEEEEPSASEEAGVVVMALLPWGISILFHAALVVLAFFIIWAVIQEQTEEELIIPDVRLSENPGAPLTMKQMEKVTPSSARRSVTRTTTPTQTSSLTTKVNLKTPLIGVQGSVGGKSSPFGTTVGEGAGFNANFFGSGGNARNIVFVVDASGSLLDTFPFVILELKKTVRDLSEKQSFTIIFFQGDEAVEVPAPRVGMKPATAEVKQQVIDWIDPAAGNIQPRGGTNPLPGMQKALRYRPQLLYLLSDNITGGGTGATQYEIEQKRLLDEIERANTANTKINTIQFLYPDPLSKVPGKKGTLEQIAGMTGGIYKFVDAGDLNIN